MTSRLAVDWEDPRSVADALVVPYVRRKNKVAPLLEEDYGDCFDCAKKVVGKGRTRCAVLTEMIGRRRGCFAYSRNPDWEREAELATQRYAAKKLGSGEEIRNGSL